ncbi:MAG: sigma 54-dependent Fis family transcriptional regulator [Myxococcales bacterium]|nr:sigma 54-dependent Fis family transcriptional regulator [Myxococcales bacterium]
MPVDDLRSGTWVTYVGGQPRGVRVRRCRVDVLAGPDKGLVTELESSCIRVGARQGNEVQLSDSGVSGLHFEIALDDRGYRLKDLDSTNGTFVSGLRVNDIYMEPETVIQVGATQLRFQPLSESIEVELASGASFGGMTGESVKMRELFARLEKIAPSDATVLITGETGVGKELVAEAMHELSPRSTGNFVVLDCGSIPQSLIESELFGHERGAFTGATSAHAGVFERAHKGVVFLDEIGELPLSMQPKLLRVLERKEVRRIGGSKTINVDIRVVAATNRDLGVEVNRGRFREDLYYRLAVARVHVPPLRDRREDIDALIKHFLDILPGAKTDSLSPETIELMQRHDWPGNVRELRNVIERAVLLSESPLSKTALRGVGGQSSGSVSSATSSSQIRTSEFISPEAEAGDSSDATVGEVDGPSENRMEVVVDTKTPFKLLKQELISEFERRYITQLLDEHDHNISSAARAAGIDRMSIHKMLNRLGLTATKG